MHAAYGRLYKVFNFPNNGDNIAMPKKHIIGMAACAVITAIVVTGIFTNSSINAWLLIKYIEYASKGTDNFCPVCGQTSNFLPVGTPKRDHALCGRCGSLERHRLLYIYLKENSNLFTDNLSVLHFSPNAGLRNILSKQKNLRYITSEYDGPADLNLDLMDVKLPDSCFDVAICFHVFEHIPDDRKAMKELYRILKPGGWAAVQVPFRNQPDTLENPSYETEDERNKYYGQKDHLRYYGSEDFKERLESVGFIVSVKQPGLEINENLAKKYSINRTEKIFIIHKPAH
jgi:SAM-dependent methyltransferase